MSAIQSEVFEALRAIDIPEDKAVTAAAALSRRDEYVASIRADLLLLKWMMGLSFAVSGSLIWLVLRVAAKVGALP
jgi:hypothetical protein